MRLNMACRFMGALMTATMLWGIAPTAAAEEKPVEVEIGNTFAGNYLAGRLAYRENDTVSAATFFRGALSLEAEGTELFDDTLILEVAAGHEKEAAALAETMLANKSDNRLARLVLATRAIRGRQYVQARKFLAETTGNPLADLTSGLLSAWTFAGTGDFKGAQSAIAEIQSGGSDDIEKLKAYHAGLIAEQAGDLAKAEANLAAAFDADNRVLRVVLAYARVLMANKKTEDAREVFAAFNETVNNHPLILGGLRDIAEGRAIASDIKTPQEGAAEVFYGLGSALGHDSADRLGTIYLQLSAMLDADAPLNLITLASHVDRSGDQQRAAEIYSRVPLDSPLGLSTAIARARIMTQIDQTDEAIDMLKELISEYPDDTEAPVALGDILRDDKRFDEAALAYTTAIGRAAPIENNDWVLFYFRGMSYERAKDWPKAEADLKRALQLEPDHPFVLNYLGYSWVDQGLYLDEAMDMIKKAVELRPNDGYIVDSLGWAYYKLGRWEEAVEQLERAVQLRPQDPILNDHLGDAYWRAGRKLEARFQWNHARDLDPEPADLMPILDKIANGMPEDDGVQQSSTTGNGTAQ